MYWYLKVLKQYADFNGRARRKEYWVFALINVFISVIAMILDNIFGIAIEGVGYGPLYGLYALAILVPALAVTVRRLHDVGKSGWMIFISLIPLVGTIWLLVLLLTDGDTGENEYGANPKEVQTDDVKSDDRANDLIILVAIIWMFSSRLFWIVITEFSTDYYSTEWFESVNLLLGFIWAAVPIGLAFAVRDKSKRLALFILGGIYFLYGFYETIKQIVEISNPSGLYGF